MLPICELTRMFIHSPALRMRPLNSAPLAVVTASESPPTGPVPAAAAPSPTPTPTPTATAGRAERVRVCSNAAEVTYQTCSVPGKVSVVINIYERNSVDRLLTAASKQTMLPDRVLVVQNENHVDVVSVIKKWTDKNKQFPVHHIHLSINGRWGSPLENN